MGLKVLSNPNSFILVVKDTLNRAPNRGSFSEMWKINTMQELNNSFAGASPMISTLADTNPLQSVAGFAWGSFLEQSVSWSGAVGWLWACAEGDH